MVELRDYQLIGVDEQAPVTNRDVLGLAILHNDQKLGSKISIFKAFQQVRFSLDENARSKPVVVVKGILIPSKAINVIISNGYCVVENNLFFFNETSIKELVSVFQSKNKSEMICALKSIPTPRGLQANDIYRLLQKNDQNAKIDASITSNVKLYPYQKAGVSWLRDQYSKRQGGILADDMGLGKTVQIITFIASCLKAGIANQILIIVPNSLIANWIREFGAFTKGVKPYVHWGAGRVGFSQELEKHKVVISTYSTVANDLTLFQRVFFDVLVMDEASLIKNPQSQRTYAVTQLNAGFVVAMTGTPFENSMLDLWSITNVISPNFLGEQADFRDKYVVDGVSGLTEEKISYVENKVRTILLRRMKEEVLSELPAKLDIYKPLTMNSHEYAGYKNIEEQIKSQLTNKNSAFSLISQLRKHSAHPLLFDDNLKNATLHEMLEASSKFSFLESSIHKIKARGQKALVFANHIALLDKFVDIFSTVLEIPSFKVDGTVPPEERQNVIDGFSKLEGTALMFLNPVTAGMGLNITSANHVFHYSRQWNPALEAQATARAYRNGQENSVNVYYLYYADTIEETINDRIMIKNDVASSLIRVTNVDFNEDELILKLLEEDNYIEH